MENIATSEGHGSITVTLLSNTHRSKNQKTYSLQETSALLDLTHNQSIQESYNRWVQLQLLRADYMNLSEERYRAFTAFLQQKQAYDRLASIYKQSEVVHLVVTGFLVALVSALITLVEVQFSERDRKDFVKGLASWGALGASLGIIVLTLLFEVITPLNLQCKRAETIAASLTQELYAFTNETCPSEARYRKQQLDYYWTNPRIRNPAQFLQDQLEDRTLPAAECLQLAESGNPQNLQVMMVLEVCRHIVEWTQRGNRYLGGYGLFISIKLSVQVLAAVLFLAAIEIAGLSNSTRSVLKILAAFVNVGSAGWQQEITNTRLISDVNFLHARKLLRQYILFRSAAGPYEGLSFCAGIDELHRIHRGIVASKERSQIEAKHGQLGQLGYVGAV